MIKHEFISKSTLIQHLPFPRGYARAIDSITGGGRNLPEACFNPSIARYGRSLWMAYRAEGKPFLFPTPCVVRLNERFEPQFTTNKVIDLWSRWVGGNCEDVRLVPNGPEMWAVYNDGGRIWIARLDSEMNTETCVQLEADFRLQPIEKNWAFFSYDGALFCVYQSAPEHAVLELEWMQRQPVVSKKHVTSWAPQWEFGEIRGGSPPVLENGEYVTFFHSWQTDDRFDRIYHAGAYAFESKPPFRPLWITSKPLFSAPFQGVPRCRNSAVVFPCGAVRAASGWVVSYGLHDWDCCLARIPDEDLRANLVNAA